MGAQIRKRLPICLAYSSPDSSSSRLQIVFRTPRKVAASGILVSDSSFRSFERRHGCVDTCTVPQLKHTIQPSSSKTAMVTIQVGGLLGQCLERGHVDLQAIDLGTRKPHMQLLLSPDTYSLRHWPGCGGPFPGIFHGIASHRWTLAWAVPVDKARAWHDPV